MDDEYVQEHILTGGIVARVGAASPPNSWPLAAIPLDVIVSYPAHMRRAPHSSHAWSALGRSPSARYLGSANATNLKVSKLSVKICS